jgi:hypothetical protein
LISEGGGCTGSSGTVQTASLSEGDEPTKVASKFETCGGYKGPLTAYARGNTEYVEKLPIIKEVFIPEKYFINTGSQYANYPGDFRCSTRQRSTGRANTVTGLPELEFDPGRGNPCKAFDNEDGTKSWQRNDEEPLELRGWCVSAVYTPRPGYAGNNYRMGIRRPGCKRADHVYTPVPNKQGKFYQSTEPVSCDRIVFHNVTASHLPIVQFVADTGLEVDWESPIRRFGITSENACSKGPHIMREGECVPITESTPICPKENIPHPTPGQRYGTDPMDFYHVQGIICRRPYWDDAPGALSRWRGLQRKWCGNALNMYRTVHC